MAQTRPRSTALIREEQLREDPSFAAYWERTTLARAVALAVIGYRAKEGLTQSRLAAQLGIRQPQVARLEMGEHHPSLEVLQKLARVLGLRLILEVAPTDTTHQALVLPSDVRAVEDVTADGSRIRVAVG